MLKHSRIFRSFLISYVVILLIPCIGGYISYRTSISVTQSISIENGITQLQKSQELLERRMAEVEGFTRQLAISQEINVLMNDKSGSMDVYGIWRAMRNVLTFGQTNDFLQNYYIYLANYDLIVTPGSSYRPEHYYESFHYGDLSFDEWKKEVLRKTHRSEIKPLSPFTDKYTQTSVITYMQSLPLDSFNDSSPAVAVIIIDEKTIASLLSGLTERYGGWVHISDANGNTIVLQGKGGGNPYDIEKLQNDPAFDEHKVSQFYKNDLVITTRSDKNGWVYQAGIPRSVLMENANKIKRESWLITGTTMLIGLVIGLALAYRNSSPINQLIGVVKEQFGKSETAERNEFDFLAGNIASMIKKNKLLETELDRQLPLVRDAFIKRLIAGEFESRDEIFSAAEQADINLNQGTGFTGILKINGYSGMDNVEILNELNAARLLLKQALTMMAGPLPMSDMGSDKVVVLFFAPADDEEHTAGEIAADEYRADEHRAEERRITRLMQNLAQYAASEYRITIQAGFGELFSSVLEVGESFEQAKQALEYAAYSNKKGMIWSREAQTENATYYYPLETEQRLAGTIRAGELEESKRMIDLIVAQNLGQRELSVEMKHQLVGEMKGTFLKLLDQKVFLESPLFEHTKRRIIDIRSDEPLEAAADEFHAVTEVLCGFIANKKKDTHIQLIKDIYGYTENMYADSELTLYRVAEYLERPEKYISQLFKEATGVNYSDHLIKVRMDRAVELLKESNYTVDEIAARVGYNSSHSFRRAFKRLMGISPSIYRQSCSD